ncbi:hypothetical protein [Bacillus suaedae]|uniref:HeH/LEM domain-containing protein n=1 Tax=Halalkalibacter suaedae TaxID=2822140 RepID=A0A941ANT2_9BACI|nr:hypothetical protein [Bacillus suaedae]MBP3951131.1 hypothetical protein [Bacillus suaedae]
MRYTVLNTFNDLEHNVLYKTGDSYPAEGKETSEERVSVLQSKDNKYNRVFIGEEVNNEPDGEDGDLSKLTATELKKIKNEDLQAYLNSKNIEYKSDNNKDELINLVLGK